MNNKSNEVNAICKKIFLIMIAVILCTLFPSITPIVIILAILYIIRCIYKYNNIKKEQERPIADPLPKKPVVQYSNNGYIQKTGATQTFKDLQQVNSVSNKETLQMQESLTVDAVELPRQYEIMYNCQDIIDNSTNLNTVVRRYNMLIDKIRIFALQPDDNLKMFGSSFMQFIRNGENILNANKAKIFCYAINRAFNKCKERTANLKTEKGKENALKKFQDETLNIISENNLPTVCVSYLDELISSGIPNESNVKVCDILSFSNLPTPTAIYNNVTKSYVQKNNEITKKMFDEFGVQMYKVWVTARDGDICPDCAKMEGACVPIEEKFVLDGKEINDPPLCDNCRCDVIYTEEPVPELRRCYEALKFYSEMANTSEQFQGSHLGYFTSLYFLRKLAAASPSELSAAGLKFSSGYDFDAQISNIEANRTKFLNQAIQRAYDYEVKNAASLKTERGRKNRLLKLKEYILSFDTLLPENIEYLNKLIPDQEPKKKNQKG